MCHVVAVFSAVERSTYFLLNQFSIWKIIQENKFFYYEKWNSSRELEFSSIDR